MLDSGIFNSPCSILTGKVFLHLPTHLKLFSRGHSNFLELEYLFLIEHLMEYEDFLLRPFLLAHQTSNELF